MHPKNGIKIKPGKKIPSASALGTPSTFFYWIIWEFFTNMGGGSSQFPKLKTKFLRGSQKGRWGGPTKFPNNPVKIKLTAYLNEHQSVTISDNVLMSLSVKKKMYVQGVFFNWYPP